ncbi:MAG: peptide ABC transporter substrate-binding protein [Clostridia bacterium]|nr:peptide ABC transporter substrate-binding protein [Clostridia bacterium]
MKKTLAMILALVLALTSVSFAFAEDFDVEAYGVTSSELYNAQLGEFYEAYMAGRSEVTNLSLRFALMAIAEAKLMESAMYVPGSSNGGNYAIGRVAANTATSALWGNDSYRYHDVIIVNEDPVTSEQWNAMKTAWAEKAGTGTYEQWVKDYLTAEGYTFNTEYALGYSSDPKTWDVLATSRAADSEAIVNTYDGLVEYDMENVMQPALATEWSVDETGTKYTFKIREGVIWVDSQGRKVDDVTADDFVAGMNHMLDAMGGLEYLVGSDGGCGIVNAQQYIDGEISDFSQVGVKALDDYTLEYTLEQPAPYFMTMLGYGVFAPMSREYFLSQGGGFGEEYAADSETYLYGKDPDHIAYCGPYVVTNLTPENTIVFSANESYWNKDNINLQTITWKFNDGQDALKAYNDMKANVIASAGLNASALEVAKQDGYFDKYVRVSATDATSFGTFMNINRQAFANVNDGAVASTQTPEDAARTKQAMQNVHFRRAIAMGYDRAAYNAQTVGEELKLASVINSYTPGNFAQLTEDVTVAINGVDTTFAAGTYYGAIMQAQIDADKVAIKVWDPTLEGGAGASFGFDGWFNPENAKAELAIAIEELAAEGLVIDAEHPIYLDLPAYVASTTYNNRAQVIVSSIEESLGGLVKVNKTEAQTGTEWYYAGYYTDYGYEANYDLYDVSGWSPDYGDPQTYLDTFLPDYAGYMVKCTGIF